MEKDFAIRMIDDHKNRLQNPVEMLEWTWLRVILMHISSEAWEEAITKTEDTMSL